MLNREGEKWGHNQSKKGSHWRVFCRWINNVSVFMDKASWRMQEIDSVGGREDILVDCLGGWPLVRKCRSSGTAALKVWSADLWKSLRPLQVSRRSELFT